LFLGFVAWFCVQYLKDKYRQNDFWEGVICIWSWATFFWVINIVRDQAFDELIKGIIIGILFLCAYFISVSYGAEKEANKKQVQERRD